MKKSIYEESKRYYEEHYETIFKQSFEAEGKIYLKDHKDGASRLCRFCGKGTPEVSFKKTAHAVPEFLGNRRIISLNECDECNHFLASQYEDHLGRWSIIDRAIFRIQNKSKKPKYKDFDNLIRIESDEHNLKIKVIDSELTHELIKAGEPYKFKKNIEITSQHYIPIRAAMTLIKMACSICPIPELSQCQAAINWLMNPEQSRVSKYPVLKTFTPGDINNTKSEIILLKRKVKEPVPYLLCVVQYINFRLQTFIPFCPEDSEWLYSKEKFNLNLMHYPSLFGPDNSTRITENEVLDWSGTEPTQRHITVTINVNSATKIENDTDA